MALLDSLKWRYAAKRMNGEKLSQENLNIILEAIQLSASSAGLQPYTIMVVSNPDVKKQLQAAAFGQPQLVESSHVLVFCAWEKITKEDVTGFVEMVAAKRSIPVESLEAFQEMVQGNVARKTQAEQQIWSAKQAYTALGTGLAAAAELQIDSCPMEGFDAPQVDKILGLHEKGLKSIVMLALGYRSEEDRLSIAPKVRKPKEELFQFVA